ncbi:MAG: hypothetical protein ACK55I_48015, partial [bacterium]
LTQWIHGVLLVLGEIGQRTCTPMVGATRGDFTRFGRGQTVAAHPLRTAAVTQARPPARPRPGRRRPSRPRRSGLGPASDRRRR